MTSSLVGSEMCIRDRGGIVEAMPTTASEVGPGQPGSRRRWVMSAPMKYCLLYTSDAADDM
eukprot:6793544-Prorocentrum_lima.AAC.1